MSDAVPQRFIGLDVHKHYVMAVGIDAELEIVLPYHRVNWADFEDWCDQHLCPGDAVVLEVTTNAYTVHDLLVERVHSVTVVHPPHIRAITRAAVKTDRKAALALARLHAAGLLEGIWVPPQAIRDLRALVSERWKMTQLAAIAKNRLHSVLHRNHLTPPEGSEPFHPKHEEFWANLPLSTTERFVVQVDWATIVFAEGQKARLDEQIKEFAAGDERVPLLIQMPGIGITLAVTIIAAIGDVTRFPTARKLVGYSGLGARVHESGMTLKRGPITKSGRKDLRAAMVQAAFHAVRKHPYWKAWYEERLDRLGPARAQVAVARKLLVAVWHVLTKGEADRFADPVKVARSFFKHAYAIKQHIPANRRKLVFVRYHLDRLGIGEELTHLPWGSRNYELPTMEEVAEERERQPG